MICTEWITTSGYQWPGYQTIRESGRTRAPEGAVPDILSKILSAVEGMR
jgi:hypothetical protein